MPHEAGRPTAAAGPMQAVPWDDERTRRLQSALAPAAVECLSYLHQNFFVVRVQAVVALLTLLHRQEGFDFLTDLTAVDRPNEPLRFEVIYFLYSFATNERVRVKTRIDEQTAVPSITSLFAGANWLEREVYDMFGIRFEGHPDLRRMLLPEEWVGHPLRKDRSLVDMDNAWVQSHLGIESGQ